MRIVLIIACLACLSMLFGLCLQCTGGSEPEVVVVPVGEPSGTGGDPYDTGGDLGCGGESVSATVVSRTPAGGSFVLAVFVGTRDIWFVYLSIAEYLQLERGFGEELGADAERTLTREDVDFFHTEFCADPGERSEDGRRLYSIAEKTLAGRLSDIQADICR